MSRELKSYLHARGVATSHSSPYHPTGNSQCERINLTVWRTIKLMLRSRNLPEEYWEHVLQDALYSVRSLLCTSTNETPHDRFLGFPRKSMLGKSMPNWLLNPGIALIRKFVRNKWDPLCDEVDLIEANPSFARVRFPNGTEATVSTKDLASYSRDPEPFSPVNPTVTTFDGQIIDSQSTKNFDQNVKAPNPIYIRHQLLIFRSNLLHHQMYLLLGFPS